MWFVSVAESMLSDLDLLAKIYIDACQYNPTDMSLKPNITEGDLCPVCKAVLRGIRHGSAFWFEEAKKANAEADRRTRSMIL